LFNDNFCASNLQNYFLNKIFIYVKEFLTEVIGFFKKVALSFST